MPKSESERISVLDFIPAAEHAAIRACTSTYDCTSEIQAAIDYAIYGGGKRVVHIPAGRYLISGPIHLGYGTSFSSVVVEGDGYSYRSHPAFSGTAVVCTHSNAPGFNFQGGRGSVLRDLGIAGKNAEWINSHRLGSNTPGASLLDDTAAANWVDPSLDARAATRYAPYAAITVDAYAGKRPEIAYPNVRYPPFLGTVEQYGKSFSSDCLIENVYIYGFVVGICNQPCDADGNGDFTVLRRIGIDAVQYAISVCNTQSRNVRIEGVKVGPAYCALTTRRHGRQAGKLNGTISELSVSEVINVLDIGGTAYAGPLTFLHLYGEAMWRIGDIQATSSNETSVIFQSCQFAFTAQNTTRGIPATVLGGGQQAVDIQFIGCALNSFPSVASIYQVGVRLDGTAMFPTDRHAGSVGHEYQATAHNATCGGLILNNLRPTGRNRIKFKQIDLDTLAVGPALNCDDDFPAGSRPYCIPIYAHSAAATHDAYGDSFRRPLTRMPIAKSGMTDVVLTNTTLSFTLPNAFTDSYITNHGFEVGDVIWDDQTGMVFFIRARAGRKILAEAQNNYKSDGAGGHTTVVAFSTTTGNLYSTNCRLFTPVYPMFGNTSTASAVISSVQRADGFSKWFDAEISVGDSLFVDEFKDDIYPLIHAVVTARDPAFSSITLSGNASFAQTQRRLHIWVRKSAENV